MYITKKSFYPPPPLQGSYLVKILLKYISKLFYVFPVEEPPPHPSNPPAYWAYCI